MNLLTESERLHMSEEARDSAFIRKLRAFLTAIEDDEATIYDGASWRARGEEYGNEDSMVWTITTEGMLHSVVNDSCFDFEWGQKVQKVFSRFLERHGLWYGLGYAWSIHLYRDETSR